MRNLLQYTLDLFGPAPQQAQPSKPTTVKRQNGKKDKPAGPTTAALSAPEFVADMVALEQPVSGDVAMPHFSHPHATRQAQLGNVLVAYAFKRAKRRTIGFVVGAQGLVVSAPRWVPLAGVDAAVRDKGGWIVQKLGEAKERQARQQASRIVWQNGAMLPYLGQALVLVLAPAQRGALLVGGCLQLGLPLDAPADKIRAAVHKWLLAQARILFAERLNHFAPQLDVQWLRLALSSAATRWGSASATGAIRLNWRLLHHRMEVLDYVVVHELSHLRHMDHSARFWSTVGSILPGYPALRAELRSLAIPKWDD